MPNININFSKEIELDVRRRVVLLMTVQSGINNAGKCYLQVCPDSHYDIVVTETLKLT